MSMKSHENHVRRAAARQGLVLAKSRTRNPRAYDYGTYGLVCVTAPGGHWRSRWLVAGDQNTDYGLTLDEVEEALAEYARSELQP
jgi:hypothetical protein